LIGGNGNQTLPAYGSAYPGDTSAFLDSYTVEQDGSIMTFVANYSRDRRFEFPDPPERTLPEGVGKYYVTFTDVVTQFPYAELKVQQLPGNLISLEVPLWLIRNAKILRTRTAIAIKVVFPSSQINAAVTAIRQQANKIHIINGKPHQFKAGNVEPVAEKPLYQTMYTWVHDPGVKISQSDLPPNPDNKFEFPPLNGAVRGGLPPFSGQIPPFHILVPRPQVAPTLPPVFETFFPFETDADGHLSLVGLVLP
jgi:hypothetical protein